MGIMDIGLRRMLSCYDMRLEQDKIAELLGMKKDTLKKTLQRLRQAAEKKRIIAAHLRQLEALGFRGVIAELEPPDARELLRRIRPLQGPVPPSALDGVVPLPRLLATVIKIANGPLYATYRAPRGVEEEITSLLGGDKRFRRIIDTGFYSVPVRGCLSPEEAEEFFEKQLGYEYPSAMPLPDMLAMGVLDLNPLARLRREDMDPGSVLAARLGEEYRGYGEALYPVMRGRYRVLSREGLLGRVYYVKPSDALRSRSLVVAPRESAAALYRAAVETMGAAYVASGEEVALVTASAEAAEMRRRAVSLGGEVVDIAYAVTLPPPLELYDCRRRAYTLEPLPGDEVVACLEAAAAETGSV
jgi:hypothetical protein